MADIRFECKYCNKPINVHPKFAGQRMKCPSCKNPVVCPGQAGGLAQSYNEADQTSGLKRVDNRAVKKGGIQLGGIVKLIVIGAVLFGAYKGYGWWTGQAKKPLATLLKEMADGGLAEANRGPIEQKLLEAKEADGSLSTTAVNTLANFKKSKAESVRSLVASHLGASKNKAAIKTLWEMLKNDESADIRRSAAEGLGEVGYEAKSKKVITDLVDRMGREKDGKVVGGIHGALRTLTANVDNHPTAEAWKMWWGKEKAKFEFGAKGTR